MRRSFGAGVLGAGVAGWGMLSARVPELALDQVISPPTATALGVGVGLAGLYGMVHFKYFVRKPAEPGNVQKGVAAGARAVGKGSRSLARSSRAAYRAKYRGLIPLALVSTAMVLAPFGLMKAMDVGARVMVSPAVAQAPRVEYVDASKTGPDYAVQDASRMHPVGTSWTSQGVYGPAGDGPQTLEVHSFDPYGQHKIERMELPESGSYVQVHTRDRAGDHVFTVPLAPDEFYPNQSSDPSEAFRVIGVGVNIGQQTFSGASVQP